MKAADRRRSTLVKVVKLVVSAGLLGYLASKVGIRRVGWELTHLDPRWLAAALSMSFAAVLVSVVQWTVLLNASDMRRSFRRVLQLDMVGRAFDSALPSSIGGDVVRSVMVADSPRERVTGAQTIILRRVTGIPGMVVLLVAGLLAALGVRYSGRIIPYAGVCAAAGLAAMLAFASPIMHFVAGRPALQRTKLSRLLAQVLAALHSSRSQRSALGAATLIELGFWVLAAANGWAYMRAVGAHIPFSYATVVVLTVSALSMLPISIGGIGVREGSYALFLAGASLAGRQQGAAVGVCLTLQGLVLGLLGVPIYWSMGHQRRHSGLTIQPSAEARSRMSGTRVVLAQPGAGDMETLSESTSAVSMHEAEGEGSP